MRLVIGLLMERESAPLMFSLSSEADSTYGSDPVEDHAVVDGEGA